MSLPEQAHPRHWLYRRTAPGAFVPIPIKTWDKWVYGRAALPPSDDGFVWYVTLTVWTLDRRVIQVEAPSFSKARVNPAGIQEDQMSLDAMAVALNAVWQSEEPTSTSSVVDAANRFAQRKYRWKPTAADLRALSDIVNRRAGRSVM